MMTVQRRAMPRVAPAPIPLRIPLRGLPLSGLEVAARSVIE